MPEIKCPKCAKPIPYADADEGKAVKCPACGADVLALRAAEKIIDLKCSACGGAMNLQPGSSQLTCPFCNATYLLPPTYAAPAAAAAAGGPAVPQYLAPVKINQGNMLEQLNKWLNKGVFTAGDADTATVVTAVSAKYLPLYIYTCDATSSWSGQYSTTHYRPVTRTRQSASGGTETYQDQEEYKEWHPTSGVHAGRYRVAVAASASIVPGDLDKLTPQPGNFTNDEGAVSYAGAKEDKHPLEQPSFDAAEGWRRAKVKIDALERAACDKEVERLVSCVTQVGSYEGRLSYHPFWWINYSYKGKPFNCLMDGRTGAVTGKKPKSKTKIILAIIAAVLLLIVLIIIIVCVGAGHYATTSALMRDLVEGARVLV